MHAAGFVEVPRHDGPPMNLILTICAFVLLGSLLLTDNNIVTNSVQLSAENEVSAEAIGLAQSLVDEAKTKAFDQNTAGGVEVPDSSGMSAYLGPDGGETIFMPDTLGPNGYGSLQKFNDVDDYNGYWRIIRNSSLQGDTVRAAVTYTSPASPDVPAAGKNYCKKLTVTFTSPLISRSYSLSYIFAY